MEKKASLPLNFQGTTGLAHSSKAIGKHKRKQLQLQRKHKHKHKASTGGSLLHVHDRGVVRAESTSTCSTVRMRAWIHGAKLHVQACAQCAPCTSVSTRRNSYGRAKYSSILVMHLTLTTGMHGNHAQPRSGAPRSDLLDQLGRRSLAIGLS